MAKAFLKKRFLQAACLVAIASHTALLVKSVLFMIRGSIPKGAVGVVYNVAVAAGLYFFTIHRTNIPSLLISTAIAVADMLATALLAGYYFLVTYKKQELWGTLGAVGFLVLAAVCSLAFAVVVVVIRQYMIISIVYPIKVQKEKGLEEHIGTIRTEYVNFF